MPNLVYLKQKPTKVAEYMGISALDQSVYPGSSQSRTVRTESDRETWVTGLNENAPSVLMITDPAKRKAEQARIVKDREYLEMRLGKKLHAHSDFWLGYRIQLVDKEKIEIKLDLDKPEDKLMYIVGLANREYAPDFDTLWEDGYEEAFVYVHNPKESISRKQLLQEVEDEAVALVVGAKNNKDKLFYWAAALSPTVTRTMTREDLYNIITAHRKRLTKIEQFQAFVDILSRPAEQLQIAYLVKLGIRKRRIKKEQGGMYTLEGEELGKSDTEATEFLRLSENSWLVDKLQDLD